MIPFNIDPRFEAYYAAILAYYYEREHNEVAGARHFADADEQVIGLDNTLATVHIKPLIEARLEEKFGENPELNVNPENVMVLPSFSTRDLANINENFLYNHFYHFVLSHLNAVENKEAIKHIVIPVHKDQNHYTTLNIELCDDGRAIVRYKDSMGHDYPNSTIPLVELKAALENTMGYRIESVTQYPDVQQNRDVVHCGLFTVRNAVDLINHRNDENKMPTCREIMLKSDEEYTKYWILAREKAVESLKARGFDHVCMGAKLSRFTKDLKVNPNKSLALIEFDVNCEQRVIKAKGFVTELTALEARVAVLREQLAEAGRNPPAEEPERVIRNLNADIALKLTQIEALNQKLFRLLNDGRARPMHHNNHSAYSTYSAYSASSSNNPAPSRVVHESESVDKSYDDKVSTLFFMAGLAASYFIYTLGFSGIACSLALLTLAVTGMGALSYLNSILGEDGSDELGLNSEDVTPPVMEQPDVSPKPAPAAEPAPTATGPAPAAATKPGSSSNNKDKDEDEEDEPFHDAVSQPTQPPVTHSFDSFCKGVNGPSNTGKSSSKFRKAKSDGEEEVGRPNRAESKGHAHRRRAHSQKNG